MGKGVEISDPRIMMRAVRHLKAKDPILRSLIQRHGPIRFEPEKDVFSSLVYSIISQQLSSKAADAIARRVAALFPRETTDPMGFARIRAPTLRRAGLSMRKISYLKNLSSEILEGSINLDLLKEKDDQEVLEELDNLRGVGPWTAKMILIFSLGRPDVFAHEDVGLQGAIKRIYSLPTFPDRDSMEQIAKPWHPFCSVASLYLWKYRDESSVKTTY